MGVNKHDPIEAAGVASVTGSAVVTTGLRKIAAGSAFAQSAELLEANLVKASAFSVNENYPKDGQITINAWKISAGAYVAATEAVSVNWQAKGE